MAFVEQAWGKTSVSLNNPITTLIDATVIGSPTFYTYQSATDAIATIAALDYFKAKAFELSVGDVIYCQATDATEFVTVTALTVNPNSVTVSTLSPAGVVGTANITNLAVTTAKIANNAVTSTQLALNTTQYVKVTMSAADVNGAYGAPKLILAAGGANTLIVVKEMALVVDFGTAQFAAGGTAALQYDSTVHGAGTLASASIANTVVQGWAADATLRLAGAMANGASTATVNKGLYWSNDTAAFTTGDSTVDVHVWYAVVATTL